jgi:hypothetical protein
MNLPKRLAAELFGTFWLVLGGCGSAVLAASFAGPDHGLGIGFVGVSLAFGLTVLTMAYAPTSLSESASSASRASRRSRLQNASIRKANRRHTWSASPISRTTARKVSSWLRMNR